MEKWKKVKLGDLLDEYVERNIDGKYKAVAVGRYGIRKREDIYARELSKDYSKNKVIRKNTLTIGMGSSQIDIGILNEDEVYCVSPAYTTYTIKKCDSKFLEYLLEFLNSKLSNLYMITSARQGKAVDKDGLMSYEIDLPNIGEQKVIVDLLIKIDNIIQKNEEKIRKMKYERDYIRKKIFAGLEKNNTEKKKLSEIFERITQKNVNNQSTNILTISAQDGLINQEKFFNKIVAGNNLAGYYLLKKGDFAYNKSYSNGYPVGATKMLKLYENGIVSTLYICFRAKDINIHNGFYEYVFESNEYYKELEKITQEGNRNHGLLNMNIQDFFNIKIVVPKYEEQEKIYDVLSRYDGILSLENDRNENYKELRKALMQKLLTGKVRVKI